MSGPHRQPAAASIHDDDLHRLIQSGDAIYRRLVEGVLDYAIFLLTPAGKIATWNAGAQRIKGYSAEDIIGQHFSVFYSRADIAAGWPDEELMLARERGRFEDEGWRVRKDGTTFWANVVITAIFGADNEFLGYAKVTRDLTDRMTQERRLRDSEQRLRTLVEGAKEYAMYLLDADGRIASWNDGAQRLLGYRAVEVVGQRPELFFRVEVLNPLDRALAVSPASASGPLVAGTREGCVRRADGHEFWAELTTSLLPDNGSDLVANGAVQILRDLSERRRMAALLDEGRRMTEFIAMMSHELRNPLSPIMNVLSIMAREPLSPRSQWCLDVAAKQVRQINRLVDDLLDVSRVTTGKVRLNMERLDLVDVVKEAIDVMRPALDEHGHAFRSELPETPLWTQGDRTRLIQLVSNLLGNAAKFTLPPGKIQLILRREGPSAMLEVSDNGIGMTQDTLQRAFEPFSQAESRYSRGESGLGLGLALVRSIADLHGGSAQAVSAGPGEGSLLLVRLPLEAPLGLAQARQSSSDARASAETPKRLLIIDDNVDAADSLALLLRTYGHDVSTAHDGLRGLELMRQDVPDAVLLDIGMPMLSGLDVAREIRGDPQLAGVRLIAVSGYGQPLDRTATRSAGFDSHLVKPVAVEDVLDAVQ